MGDLKFDDDTTTNDDGIEETHCTIDKVYVFQIPKLAGASTGHSARDWPKQAIWSGRLRVISRSTKCTILLEHLDKEGLFAQCPYTSKSAVEQVNDSSRYFVLRVADGQGHHASIGIGFKERSEAFNFKVALQDFENQGNREAKAEEYLSSIPSQDFSIPQGKSIHVKLAVSAPSASSTKTKKGKKGKKKKDDGGGGGLLLAAPPEAGSRQRGRKPASPSSSGSSSSTSTKTTQHAKPAQASSSSSSVSQPKPKPKPTKTGEMDLLGLDDLTIGEPSPPKQTGPLKASSGSSKSKSSSASSGDTWDDFN